MRQTIIALLFLATSSVALSQIKLEGVVKDSIGNPLELANVVAINQETKGLESYGITTDLGKFKLSLKKNTIYKLQVSYIGMKTDEQIFEAKESDVTKNFTLRNDNTLDEVNIVYEMPVVVRGDTLIYNADSFNKGTERKLEDVLKNLPGVEINDEGQVQVEGKTVSKIMVDGKEFFDGDTKLAVQNIPSNAVDKVQVLKNYSEVGQLSGVTNNQDNVAINIKLKEGKTNFWFGNITAGGGASNQNGLYLFQPKLFYYSPKYSINTITDFNNLGEIAFSRRDYFNFTGGFRSPSRSSGTNIDLGSNSLGFLTAQNNRAKAINTKFGAANFSWSPNKALDLSGFAIFSGNRTDMQEIRDVQYFDNASRNENKETNTHQSSDLGMVKLSAKYKPNSSNQLDYDILGRLSKESQDQNVLSTQIGTINELENSSPYSINQNLNYYYTLDAANIFALEIQHFLQDEDPFYNAILDNKDNYDKTATILGLDANQLDYDVAQDKRVKSNQMDAKLDYWNILNKKSDINFTFGSILSSQKFNSEIFQFLDDNSEFDPTPTILNGLDTNAIEYNFTDLYLAAHYRLKSGKFTFTPGVSAHAYSTNNTQFNVKTTDNFFRILPDFNMLLQLKKSEQITLNYKMQTQFTDVSKFASGLVLNSYSSLFSGVPDLGNALSHNINLSYFSFNLFNYTNVYASLNYNKSIDNIRNVLEPVDTNSVVFVSSPFNSGFADESASANGRFQRTFGLIRASVNGNLSYSKFNQFFQSTPTVNESFSQSYGSEIRTNFKTAPNVEIDYRYSIQENNNTKFFTKSPSIEVDALILKVLTFKTDFSYTNYSDEDKTINNYKFWNASLAYKKDKDSKLEYEVKATNLFNTKAQNSTSSSNISVSATEYYIQPLFVSFRLRYEL
ncbi:carboxypeptidase-like protein [Mariniflexile fucanivorans]|uniref:Carboxypeptidase-like protein n=1 Tax=Mariniflexile fucanivorans TaxID=264023 RepID=A0A4R1RHU2_9FLAO|nr:carboxypeptidase regulatory-like domain-containing protein [Mariniflexile fucanivorans]TCL65516.1 carboxypeptidase-like protein [Mariniflexile fucanivorans]